MYAASEEDFHKASSNLCKERLKYPEFVKRYEKFYLRRVEWATLFRNQCITRNNNTNNFAEVTIRIVKDIVLCRTKAFNLVALIEFCISVWELYLQKKLLDFANSRKSQPLLLYSSMLKRSTKLHEGDIQECGEGLFTVKSCKNTYEVNSYIGACSCRAGISGAFCKHQCLLMHSKKMTFPNAPPISQEDRYKLALLACGDKCPEVSFFQSFESNEIEVAPIVETNPELPSTTNSSIKNTLPDPVATDEQKEILSAEIMRLSNLVSGSLTSNTATRLISSFKRIKSVKDLQKIFVVHSMPCRTKKIRVQPTAVVRRKGTARRNKKIPAGRPPLSSSVKRVKRKRCLKENIEQNVLNAKSHGAGH